ncbi:MULTISPECIES: hypothetical protein [Streptacidiphilus]|uniref:Uncharacterized protein n=1 Tax=Streptacidiphilus cavernicola TaxID=3342716 RepID=A0ABV6UFX1_9ACTN|nr:hypothetical protein [Streptacidiphilus jeojiense]
MAGDSDTKSGGSGGDAAHREALEADQEASADGITEITQTGGDQHHAEG